MPNQGTLDALIASVRRRLSVDAGNPFARERLEATLECIQELAPSLGDDDVARLTRAFTQNGCYWLEVSFHVVDEGMQLKPCCLGLLLSLAHERNELGRKLAFFPALR